MTETTPTTEPIAAMSVTGLVSALGARTPAPGGGAVAPIVAALGAAVARMVVNFSVGKKKLLIHDEVHRQALARLLAISDRALALADADARAYAALNELMRLEADDARRLAGWGSAVAAAMAVPRDVIGLCLELLEHVEKLPGATSRMLASDLAIGAILADASVRAAAWNVRANLPLVTDAGAAEAIRRDLAAGLEQSAQRCAAIESACAASR